MKEKICKWCVMDTSDSDIKFYGEAGCSNCKPARRLYNNIKNQRQNRKEVINRIKQAGKNKKYNCVIGVSGGVDSSYVAYLVKKLGLRPIAVHLDNGWNEELAEENINKIVTALNIDLVRYRINFEEFKDIQMAFLRASTPDCEVPTDHAISAILYSIADRYNIKYVIDGWNISSESILPLKWSDGHNDWKYIKSIHKLYGKRKIATFPYYTRITKLYYEKFRKIKKIHILNYIDYDKEKAKILLNRKFGWKDYVGKHYESFYTKFYQTYYLVKKFGFDKRKMHLSSLIVSQQLTRDEGMELLKKPLYVEEEMQADIERFLKIMNIDRKEFEIIMNKPNQLYTDYPNYKNDFIGKIFGVL